MRVAILSDIHGNRTAFEAVLKDLRDISPDLVLHGGDLADSGSGQAEIADQIRDLGWQGVLGNTDEMFTRPDSLAEFAGRSPSPALLWTAIGEMADFTREILGEERISWMRQLPRTQVHDSMALVHASPQDLWRSPTPQATDAELEQTLRCSIGSLSYSDISTGPSFAGFAIGSSQTVEASACLMMATAGPRTS